MKSALKSKTVLAVFSAFSLLAIGCSKPGDPPTVDAGKDANGQPYVHVDGKQVDRNLEQANQNLKEAGRELKAGAEDAGQAIQRGAEEVNKKVGPVAREMLDDASITARIKAKLIADPEVKAFQIDVDTVDGRVALNGKVSSADQRAEAEKLAGHTEGVKSVVNLIQVAGESFTPPPPQ
jgi:hyperosmotically inducible protein